MAITERAINDVLADLLRATRSVWRDPDVVRSENIGLLKRSQGVPDILVAEPFVSPVVVETELLPATNVEADALSRLGAAVGRTGSPVLSAIAVRLPSRLRQKQAWELKQELGEARDIEMALYMGEDKESALRWPESGWLRGGYRDLSLLIQSASIPPMIIEQAKTHLKNGVEEAAGLLADVGKSHPESMKHICLALHQEDDAKGQTRSMAATILASALVFQEALAGGPGGLGSVPTIEQMRAQSGTVTQRAVLSAWRRILDVNYWPIFDTAKRILEAAPAGEAGAVLDRLAATAEDVLHQRLMSSHDLAGAVFQGTIRDRKLLAAFYTTPQAAALLCGLALAPDKTPGGGAWGSADDVKAIRMADLACGTGTLLSTAYRRMSQLHELAGGDSEAIHSEMMGKCLTGCDILPAATHITASMLAGAHPTSSYDASSVFTVCYSKQADGSVRLGSLDLLDDQRPFDFVEATARAISSTGETEEPTWKRLRHGLFDLIIMNPPFTRAVVHNKRTAAAGIPNPMFGALGSTPEVQREMAEIVAGLIKGTSAHGNAGEASIFLVLAHRKLRPGGTLALVMPLSLLAGESWERSRKLLADQYSDLIVVSIAAKAQRDMCFSADTGIAECLVVAKQVRTPRRRATFVILGARPALPLTGTAIASQIREMVSLGSIRRLEEGPVGGTPLKCGDSMIGYVVDGPLPRCGGWALARIADVSLAQTAYQLEHRARIWLPSTNEDQAVPIPITTVAKLGKIGPCHRDINGKPPSKGKTRGPFDILSLPSDGVPTYPVLWGHDRNREVTMCFEPDSQAQLRQAGERDRPGLLEEKAARVWLSASNCHFNLDFRFTSQSTAMQFTRRKTIGGRAWPSIKLDSEDQEKVLVLWGNSSLGLLLHWWHANKQQEGRGGTTRRPLMKLPVLDVRQLSPAQLAAGVALFEEMSSRTLLFAWEMGKDATRKELDLKFAKDVLGLPDAITVPNGPLDLLREKLAAEPSISGAGPKKKHKRGVEPDAG